MRTRLRRLRVEALERRILLDGSFTFVAFGDYGFDGPGEAAVAELVKDLNPDFILALGDNNYPIGQAETIDANVGKYFRQYIGDYQGTYGSGSETNRFFPAIGNHDWWYSGLESISPYIDYFDLPGDDYLNSSGNERYYDFSYEDARFFALNASGREEDGNAFDSDQGEWLRDQLSESTARLNVVFFHESPFSSGTDSGPTPVMQWPFESWGVDLVLSAHDHNYERLHINDTEILGPGIPYFVSGLGGRSLREVNPPHEWTVHAPSSSYEVQSRHLFHDDFGVLLATVADDSIKYEFYSVAEGGTRIDEFIVADHAVWGRHLFYNNSIYGFEEGNDDDAIARDKYALLPGGVGRFDNYSSFTKGINGVMVDIVGAERIAEISADDFEFHVGNDDNPGSWPAAPAPSSIDVRPGEGDFGSDRVTIVWPDSAIVGKWLEVTTKATDITELPADDVFYFGNAPGETGNSPTSAMVDLGDLHEVARRAQENESIGDNDPHGQYLDYDQFMLNSSDFNRDGVVDAFDVSVATASLNSLTGDLNQDDRTDLLDVLLLKRNLHAVDVTEPYLADLSGDGDITRDDVAILAHNFGASPTADMLARRLRLIAPLAVSAPSSAQSAARAQSASSVVQRDAPVAMENDAVSTTSARPQRLRVPHPRLDRAAADLVFSSTQSSSVALRNIDAIRARRGTRRLRPQ